MADRTQAAQDVLLNSHEDRLDGLNGLYVPQLQAYVNALDDWAKTVQTSVARIGLKLPNPPPHLVFHA